MGCYKPLIRLEKLGKYKKAKDGHLYNDFKIISSDNLEAYGNLFDKYYKYQLIPCGKCIGCRLDYSRDWATRGYLESLYSKHNYFVTLTYDDDHLHIPLQMESGKGITYTDLENLEWKGTLIPRDLTLFLKRFRKRMKEEYGATDIKYIACGEYGSENRRPHYHIIFFNCPIPLENFHHPRVKWEQFVYYQCWDLECTWTKGISNITEASWNNIAYVARYITKKIGGEQASEHYAMLGQEKEFFRSSLKPAIGKRYYDEFKEKIYREDKIQVKTNNGLMTMRPPKYFDKMYEQEYPKDFEIIKQKRKKEAINQIKQKQEKTSLSQWEQLQIELDTKIRKATALHREL